MYGLVSIERDCNTMLMDYIGTHFEELEKFAERQIAKHGNGETALGGDLVMDMYMNFRNNSEDRDGVDTMADASRVVHSYICDMAKSERYRETREKFFTGCERESYYTEEGMERTDIAAPEEDGLFQYSDKELELALEFFEDTFEADSEDVDKKIKALVVLAEKMEVLQSSKESREANKGMIEKIISAVEQMAYKEATDEFKEAFRIKFAHALQA